MSAPSLRRRVTIASVVVVVPVLVTLVVVVGAAFAVASRQSVSAILADHVQLAQQLAARKTAPAELVRRVETHSTFAELTLADGRTFGSLPAHPFANQGQTRSLTFGPATGPLANAHLVLAVDDRLVQDSQSRLLRVLALAALAAVGLIAVGVPLAMRRALAPLDAMTQLARETASGQRGKRVRLGAGDTELGRTAAAFDDMLDALEGAEERALHAEDAMRRFVADAAHELRTPIAGISAAAAAALGQGADDPVQRERLLLLLGREAGRAGRLVDDLLDLARLDSGLQLQREAASLRGLVAQQADRVALHRPDVVFDLAAGDVTANVDPARIAQVVANLVDNAVRAMPAGGRVAVTVRRRGSVAEVRIADSGPGVPAEMRERIFDRMVRLDGDNGRAGSGLGLAIARGIARSHGGDLVCLAPQPGEGAVFMLTLPT